MHSLFAGVWNEWDKLFGKRRSKVILAIGAVIPLVIAIFISSLKHSFGIVPVRAENFAVFTLGLFTSWFLPLIILMVTADMFTGELSERTLKTTLLGPITRFKVYASKLITVAGYTALNLAIVFVVSIISSLILGSGLGMLQGFLNGMVSYTVAMLPLVMIILAAAFACQFFKSSSAAIITSVFGCFILKTLSALFPKYASILFTSYTNWHLLWLSNSVSAVRIFSVFMFLFSYSIIFLVVGYYLFERREL